MLTDLLILLIGALVFGIPIWLIVSLILFLSAKKDNPNRPKYRLMLIISSVLFGILCVLTAILSITLMNGLAHM